MSSTAIATTITTTAKSKDRSSSSSASQKFWPLKKFNLHNNSYGKAAAEEQSIALSQTDTTAVKTIVATTTDKPAKDFSSSSVSTAANEKDGQKRSKNKRLSSLLSNRRQEGNMPSSINIPESTTVETTKKQQNNNNASNTPTLTRKTGRDIGNKTRAAATATTLQSNIAASSAKQMTAKSAGSGTLGRLSAKASSRANELKYGSVRRQSEDNKSAKRSQTSPATKANDVPPQPNIMLESVQQKIQQELESVSKSKDNDLNAVSTEENEQQCSSKEISLAGMAKYFVDATSLVTDSITDNIFNKCPSIDGKTRDAKDESLNESDRINQGEQQKEKETREEREKQNSSCSSDDLTNKQAMPLLSPPVTPAAVATSLPEYSTITREESQASVEATNIRGMGMINVHSEPGSPTMCTFNVLQQSLVQPNNSLKEADKIQQQQQLSSLFVQQQQTQPIPRSIHRLRSAASFATLRQLASTNNSLQNQQQQQIQQIQQIKRRPVSLIEPSSHSNINYSNYASSVTSDDYLTVNRPIYNRRASSEDSSHIHIHQQSDNINGNAIQHLDSNTISSRRPVRSNTVHNLIIKDGQGHRIVQCVGGLDQSPPFQPLLRKNTSSFESSNDFHRHNWSPPPEVLDDIFYASRQQQQQMEEQQYHQQQYLLIQQQQQKYIAASAAQQHQQQQDNKTDTASDTSGSSAGSRRISRKGSAKSISSLCSSSPPITSYDARFEKLKNKLKKERAIVKALQKQKEACNKDVVFLNKSVDDLTAESRELKRKCDNEKTLRERFQDDLSSALDKLNEATEHIRQLENQNKSLKAEIDDKNLEIRELEKKKQATKIKFSSNTEGAKPDQVLAAQLQHSQNQVRLLKSTMEQFLRMGVFNDELNPSNSSYTLPTTSIEAILPESKYNKSRQQQQRLSNNPGKSDKSSAATTAVVENSSCTNNITAVTSPPAITPPPATTRYRKSLVPTEELVTSSIKATKTPEKNSNKQQDELDVELLELLREKEILQAEYSKAPSGGNALIRRRREELESRLDTVDSQMCRIKLKMRSRNIL